MKSTLAALLAAAWLCCAGARDAAPADAAPGIAVQLRAGVPLDSALAELNARGHRIVYSSALVTSDMTLRAEPKATRIEALLEEILSPWQLRALPTANGDWLIVAAPRSPQSDRGEAEPAAPAEPAELDTIDVSASRYALATPNSTQVFLDRSDVERMPHLADDAVRMLKVLPGVTGGDFSAGLNVRGGRRDETLLRIDGAEIHSGFHFRDLDGALSVLDTNLVDSIDFITGGLTAQYGDHMSGVVDMRTRRPSDEDEYRSAAGISFVSAYGRTGGTFSQGNGAWLASVRRGYLDLVMERVQADDEKISPRYTDVFSSLFYDLGDSTRLSAHLLLGENDLNLVSTDDDDIDSAGRGRAGHVWVTLEHGFGDRLESATVLSASSVRHWREAAGVDEQRTGELDADFRFRFLDLRSDWSLDVADRHVLLFGVNVGRAQAEYDYTLIAAKVNPTAPGGMVDISHAHELDLQGSKFGAHAAWRARLFGDLVVEAGARWDQYRYPGGLSFPVASPRANAVLGIGARGELRAAWGIAHQPQGIDQLQVEDNVTSYFRPERAQQAVLGYTHDLGKGLSARLDVYRKDYSRQRPRFENALDPVQLIPEGAGDRVRIDAPESEASGIELTLRREAERGFSGWASLAFAKARDNVLGEGWAPRLWQQRRTLSVNASWAGAKWNFSLGGLLHSGTPTTTLRKGVVTLPGGQDVDVIFTGERNGAELGHYERVDLRASRSLQLRSGRFSWYFEVNNLLNRENPCCVEAYRLETDRTGNTRLAYDEADWLPMIPSFGFQFEF